MNVTEAGQGGGTGLGGGKNPGARQGGGNSIQQDQVLNKYRVLNPTGVKNRPFINPVAGQANSIQPYSSRFADSIYQARPNTSYDGMIFDASLYNKADLN